jgi:hypothetical protein
MGSLDYSQAVSFFTGTGTWAEARTIIGDFLEFHGDDLEALGKRCIDARRTREALRSETPHLRRSHYVNNAVSPGTAKLANQSVHPR